MKLSEVKRAVRRQSIVTYKGHKYIFHASRIFGAKLRQAPSPKSDILGSKSRKETTAFVILTGTEF